MDLTSMIKSKAKQYKRLYTTEITGKHIFKPVKVVHNFLNNTNNTLLEETKDLINPKFSQWYRKRFTELGKDRVLQLASIARADGKNPPRLFNYLLKKG